MFSINFHDFGVDLYFASIKVCEEKREMQFNFTIACIIAYIIKLGDHSDEYINMYTGLSHRRYTPKVEYELKVIKGYSRLSIFTNNEVIVIS